MESLYLTLSVWDLKDWMVCENGSDVTNPNCKPLSFFFCFYICTYSLCFIISSFLNDKALLFSIAFFKNGMKVFYNKNANLNILTC